MRIVVAMSGGVDSSVAAGHGARVGTGPSTGRRVLKRGLDPGKDQACFLVSLTQSQLGAASFPVGGLTKDAVRDVARDLGLSVADKPDSQEICFVPDGDYASFIERHAGSPRDSEGAIINQSGELLGRHRGVHRFTVGQRKGLGIAPPSRNRFGAAGLAEPMYVLELRPAEHTVVIGPRSELERTKLTASHVNWIAGAPPGGVRRVTAQIRHRHQPAAASVQALDGERAAVEFDTPQLAITPGQ